MHGKVAIGNNDVFYIVPEKLLKEIKTTETKITVHCNNAVYLIHLVNEKKELEKLKEYEKQYILDYVVN